jgi:6-phospho-beta-glucosidase
MKVKVAVIGGGSSYTPELVEGFIQRVNELPVDELCLMDVDGQRLEVVGAFARRMVGAADRTMALRTTTDLEEAVEGARFVVTQIRVGGNTARIQDEKLGLRHGIIGQETTGVGGFACALRTIPKILDVARAVQSKAPDATVINFTNPSGIITEALHKHSDVEVIGLCNAPICFVKAVAAAFDVPTSRVDADCVGLNHLTWFMSVQVDDRDVFDDAVKLYLAELDPDSAWARLSPPIISLLGMIPNEYLKYYYATEEMLAELKSKPLTRGEEVARIENDLFTLYRDEWLDRKPAQLSKRGGAFYSVAALDLMASIALDRRDVQILDVPNHGAVPTLGDNVVVEVPCVVDKNGAKPIPQEPPPVTIRGLMHCVKAYEQLTIQAAVERDKAAALMALVTHPLCPGVAGSEKLLDELLDINRDHLDGWE